MVAEWVSQFKDEPLRDIFQPLKVFVNEIGLIALISSISETCWR